MAKTTDLNDESYFFFFSNQIAGTQTYVSSETSGDQFTVSIGGGVSLSPDYRWRVQPISGEVSNTVPNINATIGNVFEYASSVDAPTGTQTLTIPDGRYDLPGLQKEIQRQMVAIGHGTLVTPIFKFGGSDETAIATVQITSLGYSIDFTATDSMTSLLGFSGTVGPPASAGEQFTAGTEANFDQGVNSIVVNCSLVRGGFTAAGGRSSALMSVKLSQGSLNRLVPFVNNLDTRTAGMAGVAFTEMTFWLTDQDNRRVSTAGNPWSGEFQIKRGERIGGN